MYFRAQDVWIYVLVAWHHVAQPRKCSTVVSNYLKQKLFVGTRGLLGGIAE